jgi:uncharacterized protein YodC (DUF2158 family)
VRKGRRDRSWEEEAVLRVGDRVRHKSGGPVMVVFRITGGDAYHDPNVECRWYGGKEDYAGKSFATETFHEAELTRATAEGEGAAPGDGRTQGVPG